MQRIALADRRTALLEAALRLIARAGLADASVRDIAAEAGMPVASFHYVFASKRAMLEELTTSVLEAQRSAILASLDATRDLREFVLVALNAWLDRAVEAPEVEVALQELVAWSRTAPGMADLGRRLYEQYDGAVLGILAMARERFGAVWSVPDAEVVRLALVLTDGVSIRWLIDRDTDAARRALTMGAAALLALAGSAAR